jgi:hypothetical protein
MQDIQEIFNKIQKTKKEQREIRSMYKNSLMNSALHKELAEQIKTLREKKKEIESQIKSDFIHELSRLDDLKIEAEGDMLMLSDIALNKLVRGEHVEVTDEFDTKYEPVFNVKFRKA